MIVSRVAISLLPEADAYYSYFHSFLGFTWLSHGALFFYQAPDMCHRAMCRDASRCVWGTEVFLFMVLWSHFESLVPLRGPQFLASVGASAARRPIFSLEQLGVEVKLRPSQEVRKSNPKSLP